MTTKTVRKQLFITSQNHRISLSSGCAADKSWYGGDFTGSTLNISFSFQVMMVQILILPCAINKHGCQYAKMHSFYFWDSVLGQLSKTQTEHTTLFSLRAQLFHFQEH